MRSRSSTSPRLNVNPVPSMTSQFSGCRWSARKHHAHSFQQSQRKALEVRWQHKQSGVRQYLFQRIARQPVKKLDSLACTFTNARDIVVSVTRSSASASFDSVCQVPSLRVVSANGDKLLTSREEQVVALVSDGLSNRDVATELVLSEHTVKKYLFRIFEKLGISSRVELVLYAFHHSSSHQLEWIVGGV